MPSPKQVHSFSASSATAWIEADTSRIAQVNFMLAATGDYVSVEIALERLVGSAQRALQLTKPKPVFHEGLRVASQEIRGSRNA